MMNTLAKNLRWLRVFALLEGVSYLLLGITMPLKYQLDMGMPNKIVGMLHGVFFVVYCLLVFAVNRGVKWSLATNFWAYLASLVPFGTFIADAKIFKPTQSSIR